MSTLFFYILSLAVFITGFVAYRKCLPGIINRCLFFVLSACLLVFFIGYQAADYFTGNGIDDSVVFHLSYGLGGAGFAEYAGLIIASFGLLFVGFITLAWYSFAGQQPAAKPLKSRWVYLMLLAAFYFNPATADVYRVLTGAYAFQHQFVGTEHDDADFEDYYRLPDIKPDAGNHKNLVVIYAESLERSYFDEDVYPGLITRLRELEAQSTHFTDIKQVAATGWTIAGMTATQCGLPLYTPSHGNSMSGMDSFMQSAICIGDLLADAGYFLSYMGGADHAFGGKGKLYETHGFQEVLGLHELKKRIDDPEQVNAWGLYDDDLLDLVYQRFEELSAKDQPFSLFTLTLDTHHPRGHPTPACKEIEYLEGASKMLNSVACADYLISNLVHKLLDSPYAEQTLIVVVSDHYAMRGQSYRYLQKTERSNLFMIIDPNTMQGKRVDHRGSLLDVGTTILPFLGFETEIGLGRNLLTITEEGQEEIHFIHQSLERWRHAIGSFWDFPQIREQLLIDVDEQLLSIDGREFSFPALLEMDSSLQTTLKFEFDRRIRQQKTLLQHRLAVPFNKAFLMIDYCNNINHFDAALGNDGFCLLAGTGPLNLHMQRLETTVQFDPALIQQLTSPVSFDTRRIFEPVNRQSPPTITELQAAVDQGFTYIALQIGDINSDYCFQANHKSGDSADCSLDALARWMHKNPQAVIVSTLNLSNRQLINQLQDSLPNANERVIIETDNPYDFYRLKNHGFKSFIWAIDPQQQQERTVMEWIRQFDLPFAIALPADQIDSSLARQLARAGISLYARPVNSHQDLSRLHKAGIDNIYTHQLAPQ